MNIIQEIRNGNKDAVKQVYKENAKDVYNFAKSITGDHDSAMEATKKTFVKLFTNIQKGETPTNIRLTALKLAYDEACRIAMPSTENINSPYDREEPEAEHAAAAEANEAPAEEEIPEAPQEEYADSSEDMVLEVGGDEPAPAEPEAEEEPYDEAYDEYEDSEEYEDEYEEEYTGYNDGYDEPIVEEIDPDEGLVDEEYEEDGYGYDKPRRGALFVFCIIINVILILILIWFLIGLLVNLGVLSDTFDIGYTWFNDTIYPLF